MGEEVIEYLGRNVVSGVSACGMSTSTCPSPAWSVG